MVYHYEVSKGAGKVSHLDIILRGFTPYGDCYAISPNPKATKQQDFSLSGETDIRKTKRAPTSFRTSGLIRLATTYSRTTAGSYYHRRLRA